MWGEFRGDFLGVVACLNRKTYEFQSGHLEHFINEGIASLAVALAMTRVVQFDTCKRFHRARIAQDEVDMLAIDLVAKPLVLVGLGDKEQIVQVYLRAYHDSIAYGRLEYSIEREFSLR